MRVHVPVRVSVPTRMGTHYAWHVHDDLAGIISNTAVRVALQRQRRQLDWW